MPDANKATGHNGWISTNPDKPELKLWPLVAGLYWVMFEGDSESVDGFVMYEYGDYRGIFEINGFDEETGKPYGAEYMGGGNDWENVIVYWQHEIIKPEPYNE